MQKVLVTGAAGFIGSTLCEVLTARGDVVVGLDNFQPFYDPAIKRANLRGLTDRPNFTFVEGDIRDAGKLTQLFGDHRFDAVIHLAAMAGVRPSIQDPMLYTDINLTGSMRLFEAMRAHGCKRMMFGSSSSVYGGSTEVPFRENQVADRPVSPYAATKRAGEVLAHAYHHLFGFTIACLRFFTVYGPRQRPEMAIHQFTRLIDQGKPVPFFGDGSSRRDYTYVDDIVDGIVRALDRANGFAIYNLGGHKTTSLKELVELIEKNLGKAAVLNRLPDQPGDVPITYADITRAQTDLGYAPQTPIDVGVTKFVAWYRAQGSNRG
ncbi:MAG: GDP-mannose 4,6-dehydratase [Planctomycetes bacterium]|nr:GDP-mannose 4,6-dehydratase [Planctomycetota bacterium]